MNSEYDRRKFLAIAGAVLANGCFAIDLNREEQESEEKTKKKANKRIIVDNCSLDFKTGDRNAIPHPSDPQKKIVDISQDFSLKDHEISEDKRKRAILDDFSLDMNAGNIKMYSYPDDDTKIIVDVQMEMPSGYERKGKNEMPKWSRDKKQTKKHQRHVLSRTFQRSSCSSVDDVLKSLVGQDCFKKIGGRWGAPRPYRNGTHHGVDIYGSIGCPIYSFEDGVVTRVKWANRYGGLYVDVTHEIPGVFPAAVPSTLITRYMHLNAEKNGRRYDRKDRSHIHVDKGDNVKKGQLIAEVGRTGMKNAGAHLHFAMLHKRGNSSTFVDPEVVIEKYVEVYCR